MGAQLSWESICLTSRRSQVRALLRPPFFYYFLYGPVVQLVRTLACHARGRRFEPVPGRHFCISKIGYIENSIEYGLIAQLVEQGTENPCVSGSIPLQATKFLLEQLSADYFFFYFNSTIDVELEYLKSISGSMSIGKNGRAI